MRVQSTTARCALGYVIVPLGVMLILVGMYFSGVSWMQSIVAPGVNREFGVLESLQHILLLALTVLALRLAWTAAGRPERILFALLAIAAGFVFLEEIDYGLHYYEALAGVPAAQRAAVRNLHNIRRASGDEWADAIKRGADVLIFLYFVGFPLVARRIRSLRVRAFAPSPWLIPLLAGAFAISRLAHHLDASGTATNGALDGGLGEFRELGVYTTGFLYVAALRNTVARRPPPTPT